MHWLLSFLWALFLVAAFARTTDAQRETAVLAAWLVLILPAIIYPLGRILALL
jgi:hypothetical protein